MYIPSSDRTNADDLLERAEREANIDNIQLLDAKGTRRLIAALNKKFKDNMELRLKHSDQPEKFLESELELYESLKSLNQVAGSPELYPILAESDGCIPTLLSCLSHDNSDISMDAVEVLAELTGGDAVEEYLDEYKQLVDVMLEHNVLELLFVRLTSLNEKAGEDEAKAVFNCLTTYENIIEVVPGVSDQLIEKTTALKWLLTRLKTREFDSNKQEASELLAVMVQGNEKVQRALGTANGIDLLLQSCSVYKSKDPVNSDEEELMQNVFDILCSCLMIQELKEQFVESEGVELMHIMLENKKMSRLGAIKCLDFVTTRFAAPCDKLVDVGGLKHIFGAFMGKAKVKGPRGGKDVEKEVEERSVSIIYNLFQNLTPVKGRRERVAAKFVESEFEKCDRLLEMFQRYHARVSTEESRLVEEEEEGELDEEDLMLGLMDAGLFVLQQSASIIAHLWMIQDPSLRKRILTLLHQKGQTLSQIKEVLENCQKSIGIEGGGIEEQLRLKGQVRELLVGLGVTEEEVKALDGKRVAEEEAKEGEGKRPRIE